MKMKIIIGVVVFVILTGVVLAIVFGTGILDKDKSDKDTSKNTTPAPAITSTARI